MRPCCAANPVRPDLSGHLTRHLAPSRHQCPVSGAIIRQEFDAIIAFNSLLCIPDFQGQLEALKAVSGHLVDRGILILDIVNPLKIETLEGGHLKEPFTAESPRMFIQARKDITKQRHE
jgi:hypothetical protein